MGVIVDALALLCLNLLDSVPSVLKKGVEMQITLLCENAVSSFGCLAEWGFSAFIEFEGVKVLFDTGHSDVYKHNAQKANVDLQKADFLVLSHFHEDHTGGLRFHEFTEKKKLVLHPEVMDKLPQELALKVDRDFSIMKSVAPLEFSKNMWFLGEVPRENTFESGVLGDDLMKDDSAIAIKTAHGVVVISGCSHAGICNICEYAKEVVGDDRLHAVIGGFHLFESDEKAVEGTLNYFEQQHPPHLLPMHCVDFPTLAKFHTQFGCRKYAAGDLIHI